ncbi:MAG: bifunctional phosphoglucose/phosphomannose isomerase [Methanomassiliicoccaceae archaeon]|jgi:glucose/mannose-6-phosphate isomerase|nr:bifunctional phosphoglucose/phosphomannose isomerase [Methanomassiliicoccaceae archaeon]
MSPKNKQHTESKEMIQEVDRFVDSLSKAAKAKLKMPTEFNKLCFCGMGASAMSGDIIADAALTSWDIPVHVIRSTGIPSWTDELTLIVASSYSGNTRETLMMYEQAKAKGCKIVAMAAGGELRDRCLKDGNTLIVMPGEMQPRSAVGYTIGYLANIIEAAGGPKIRTEMTRMLPALRKYRESIWTRSPDSPAKDIAEKLYGIVPAIYATGSLSSAAIRWKNQINENAKMIAFNGAIPEMNHNEIVGWSECILRSKCRPVFLCEDEAPDPVKRMMNESIDVMRASGVDSVTVRIEGHTGLERSLKAIMLGDYVSLFLAAMNGVDPMEVETIKSFKQRLSALLGRKKPPAPKKKKADA